MNSFSKAYPQSQSDSNGVVSHSRMNVLNDKKTQNRALIFAAILMTLGLCAFILVLHNNSESKPSVPTEADFPEAAGAPNSPSTQMGASNTQGPPSDPYPDNDPFATWLTGIVYAIGTCSCFSGCGMAGAIIFGKYQRSKNGYRDLDSANTVPPSLVTHPHSSNNTIEI
mmetsp:Transcript_29159/g.38346  ORF Transcript_29159/g.38346 Transcript_29159/m.38346 type:complete len:169 (-) Transcript_29159:429-935(-)